MAGLMKHSHSVPKVTSRTIPERTRSRLDLDLFVHSFIQHAVCCATYWGTVGRGGQSKLEPLPTGADSLRDKGTKLVIPKLPGCYQGKYRVHRAYKEGALPGAGQGRP